MNEYGYKGIGELVVTFPLDEDTMTAIGTSRKERDEACGKAVALTGDNIVGFGESGDKLFGVIKGVESDGAAAIQIRGFAIEIEGTGVFGEPVAVDGTGKVIAGTDSTAIVTGVDAENGTVTILM